MLKNRLFYFAALIGTILFHTFYTGWFSWFLLLFVLVLPILSFLISLPYMLHTVLRIDVPQKVNRGAASCMLLSFSSNTLLCAPCIRFKLTVTDRMSGTKQENVVTLHADERKSVALCTQHCGAFSADTGRGKVYDLSGLFWLPLRTQECGGYLVYPVPHEPKQVPALSQFLAKSYHPKSGGGFSEIHDLREYRAGDDLHSIHWKLSAKTDSLLVRQAMEPNTGLVLLTLDLAEPRDRLDRVLSELMWLSDWLLAQQIRHRVLWLDALSREVLYEDVEKQEDIDRLIVRLLQSGISSDPSSLAGRSFPQTFWRYHIGQEDAE